jgi:hypothetical protein
MSMAQFITMHKRFGVATARPDDEEGWDGRFVGNGAAREHSPTNTNGHANWNWNGDMRRFANGNLDGSGYVSEYGNGHVNGNGRVNGVNGYAH